MALRYDAVREVADLLLTTIASLLGILWVGSLVALLRISTLVATLWRSTISLHAKQDAWLLSLGVFVNNSCSTPAVAVSLPSVVLPCRTALIENSQCSSCRAEMRRRAIEGH